MTARLTIDDVKVGGRVVCVEDKNGRWGVEAGRIYTVAYADSRAVKVEGNDYFHPLPHFILAEPPRPTLRAILAEHAPEFLAAVVDIYNSCTQCARHTFTPRMQLLLNSIERANLHAPAEVQPPAPLPAMYLGEDAFDDAR